MDKKKIKKQEQAMEKFFIAKNYIIVLIGLTAYYLGRGMYDISFMLFIILGLFLIIKKNYKDLMFKGEE